LAITMMSFSDMLFFSFSKRYDPVAVRRRPAISVVCLYRLILRYPNLNSESMLNQLSAHAVTIYFPMRRESSA